MIKNWYKINQDIWDLDLQKAKKPYHQVEDAILNTISLKKNLQNSSVKQMFLLL